MQQIRIHRSRVRREYPWYEALAPDPRDPGVVRAKALACAGRSHASAKRTYARQDGNTARPGAAAAGR